VQAGYYFAVRAIATIGVFVILLPVLARATDITAVEDEAQKAEKLLLTPLPGGEYHDSVYVREMELAAKRRSPTGALWRSFAVPGWGQIYNGKYWKSPVFIAAQGFCLYMAIDTYRTARRYLNLSRDASDEEEKTAFYDRYNDFVVETEFWGWMFVGWMFVGFMAYSMLDAYVDAHLSDWEVEDLPQDEWAPASSRELEWDVGLGVGEEGEPIAYLSISPF
jgi:hypothetical protein